ncbi:MAG: hypothetical protein KAJ47_00195 [Candidatus Aenigmarchaeota archaeon]|nr:hypothetical protein [Candidatus Aenigmarchaeota archaeon]
MEEVNFETIESTDVNFGTRNFLEIAKKQAVTDDGINTFMSISRGFYGKDEGDKRFRTSIAFPDDKEVVDAVIEALQKANKAKGTESKKK